MNFAQALRNKMDAQLQAALAAARPTDVVCAILTLSPKITPASKARPHPADFPSRTEWRGKLIDLSRDLEDQTYGPILKELGALEVKHSPSYAGVVVIEGRGAELLKALNLPGVERGELDRPLSLVEPLPVAGVHDPHKERRDRERFEKIRPLLAEILPTKGAAYSKRQHLLPRQREQATGQLIAEILSRIHQIFAAFAGAPVAVTLKTIEDAGHFRTTFAAGVENRRIKSEPPRLEIAGSLSGAIFGEGKIKILPDATRELYELNLKAWPERLKYVQSLVGAPIVVDGSVCAALVIDAKTCGVFRQTKATARLVRLCARKLETFFSRLRDDPPMTLAQVAPRGQLASAAQPAALAQRQKQFGAWLKKRSQAWHDSSGRVYPSRRLLMPAR